MGLKGYLYRKLKGSSDENRARKIAESTIRKKEFQQHYGKIYAEQYRKQLEQQAKAQFKQERERGFKGGARGRLRGAIKKGFLRPDHAAISNALYGTHSALIPRPVGQVKKIKQRATNLSDLL